MKDYLKWPEQSLTYWFITSLIVLIIAMFVVKTLFFLVFAGIVVFINLGFAVAGFLREIIVLLFETKEELEKQNKRR